MPNITRTVIDTGSIALKDEQMQDEIFTAASGKTFPAGTLLARNRVALTVTPSAVSGTGNGTCTAASVVTGEYIPKAGNYKLVCVTALANGGTFRLEDPDGQVVAGSLTLTVGAGAATVFKAGGLQFTITDGGTDFVVGDFFTLPVTAGGKLVVYDPAAGAGGAQIPVAVMVAELVTAGAGDNPIRALVRGLVNQSRLVIDAGTTITFLHLDQLRRTGIVPVDVKQLAALDN